MIQKITINKTMNNTNSINNVLHIILAIVCVIQTLISIRRKCIINENKYTQYHANAITMCIIKCKI